jgi:hypothetical protein
VLKRVFINQNERQQMSDPLGYKLRKTPRSFAKLSALIWRKNKGELVGEMFRLQGARGLQVR